MGKTARYLTTILILFTFYTYGQHCNPNMVKVNIDSTGCETVEVGSLRFSHFFYAEKHLVEIRDSIPELKKSFKKERKETKEIEDNLKAEIDSTKSINTILKLGRDEAINTAIELEVDNLYLQDELNKEKPKKWWYSALAVALYETIRRSFK